MTAPARVLVTDGDTRAALSLVRSLGRAGHRVFVGASRTPCLAGGSRYARSEMELAAPSADPERFVDELAERIDRRRIDVLLPVREDAQAALLPRRERVEPAAVPGPREPVHRRVSDRRTLEAVARRLGLETAEDASAGASRRVLVVLHRGDPAAVVVHRSIGGDARDGRGGVHLESLPPDPELVRSSVELLSSFGWQGLATVTFRGGEEPASPVLLGVGAGVPAAVQLAVDAGVDVPALLVEAALGHPLPPPPDYRPGVRLRWIRGDVGRLLDRLRGRPDGRNGAGRIASLLRFVGSWRPGERWETLRLTDPRPFFRESAEWMRKR